MLNGKGPYRFIFDTGGANIIDPAVAKEIGASGSGSAQGSGVGSQTESFNFARVSTLQIGDAVLTDQLFAVAPTRHRLRCFGGSSGRRIDRLGSSRALRHDLRLRRQPCRARACRGAPSRRQSGTSCRSFFYGTQPQIACTIDGIPAECTIDTGARDTITFMSPFIAATPAGRPARH